MNLQKILHLAKYYARSRFMGHKDPIVCGVKLTHRCTLKCKQCPYWRRPTADLSFKELQELFPLLYDKGIRILILEGGEPLFWKDEQYTVHDVVREARKYFW